VFINISDPIYEYLEGHQFGNKTIFPGMGYIVLVWETFALMHLAKYTEFPVIFENVEFLQAVFLEKDVVSELDISINPKSGKFDIFNGTNLAAQGYITHPKGLPSLTEKNPSEDSVECPAMSGKDFYKHARLRGNLNHHGAFERIDEIKFDGSAGKLRWDNNWITFLDGIFQSLITDLGSKVYGLAKSVQKLTIDPELHSKLAENVPVLKFFKISNGIRCGGVELIDGKVTYLPKRKSPGINLMRSHKFISHIPTERLSLEQSVMFCLDIAIENIPLTKAKIVEVGCTDGKDPILNLFMDAMIAHPKIAKEVYYLTAHESELDGVEVVNKPLAAYSDCLFVIASKCLKNTEFLQSAPKQLTNGGFIISRESSKFYSEDSIHNLPANLQVIAVIPSDENETLVLLQLITESFDPTTNVLRITNLENETYEWLEKLKQLVKLGPVIVYSQYEPFSGIMGLVRCIRKEMGFNSLQCVLIDDPQVPPFDVNHPIYARQLKLGLALNVLRNGAWGSYRHFAMNLDHEAKHITDYIIANISTKGDLSSFKWVENSELKSTKEYDDIISVQYAALNFRDVIITTGKIIFHSKDNRPEFDQAFGFEYAGVKSDGTRVMGLVEKGAIATYVKANPSIIFNCPDDWTLAEAATIPSAYATVYTAFFDVIQIEKGKSVLIHAGSGGVGLAAIRVAFAYGLEVFTTVSTEEKRKFLLKEFPQLKKQNIGNSRDTSFEDMIMKNTNGRGVDFVLNSLTDEKLQASIRCLAECGKFIEIGLSDILRNNKLEMKFLENKSFHSFDHLGYRHNRDKLMVSYCALIVILSYLFQRWGSVFNFYRKTLG
jgi:fatty acid synthase